MLLNGFVTSQGKNCILGNVYNAMSFYKLNIKESDLFFWFSPFDGDRILPELFQILYNVNQEYEWIQFVKNVILSGNPVIMSIDPKALPYMDIQVGDSSAKHYINVLGIDERKSKIYISDSYVPKYVPTVYEGWVDYSQIKVEDIGHCWSMKTEVVAFFKNTCGREQVIDFSICSALERIKTFLYIRNTDTGQTGLESIKELSKSVKDDILNQRYEKVFALLAGMRLNIINPLVYLSELLENIYPSDINQKMNELINEHWERVNVKLIKFALAHKRLDPNKVFKSIDEAVLLESHVLTNLINRLQSRNSDNIKDILHKLKQERG